ncbi:MAG: DMT family transporter [Clostridia bacterium]|nr:DMT family transporter [Clostridia bacterium]
MNRQTKLALLATMTGNTIFGFSFMFSRLALAEATPFTMLMYRFILAFAGLNLLALWAAKGRKTRKADSAQDFLRFDLHDKPVMPLLALGVVQPVVYFLCESYGIAMTNASFSGVIIALVPIAALGLGALLLKEIPTRKQVLCSLVSIAGVIVMTLQQSAEGEIQPLGVVLLFGAVLSGVMFNIISRGISGQFSPLERTYVMMGVGAVAFTALAIFEQRANPAALLAPLGSTSFMLGMAYLSLASSIGAFLVLNYASGHLPVAKMTAFCNLTTVISVFAGVVFLHEPFSAVSLIASAVIILGIWGVQRAG